MKVVTLKSGITVHLERVWWIDGSFQPFPSSYRRKHEWEAVRVHMLKGDLIIGALIDREPLMGSWRWITDQMKRKLIKAAL